MTLINNIYAINLKGSSALISQAKLNYILKKQEWVKCGQARPYFLPTSQTIKKAIKNNNLKFINKWGL